MIGEPGFWEIHKKGVGGRTHMICRVLGGIEVQRESLRGNQPVCNEKVADPVLLLLCWRRQSMLLCGSGKSFSSAGFDVCSTQERS